MEAPSLEQTQVDQLKKIAEALGGTGEPGDPNTGGIEGSLSRLEGKFASLMGALDEIKKAIEQKTIS